MTATSVSHDVDLPTGNGTVFDARPRGLSDQQRSVPEATGSKEEGTQLASSLAETTQATVSLATEKLTSAGVQKTPLASTLKPSATTSLHQGNGIPSNSATPQNAKGHLMDLDPLVSRSLKENDSQDLEQAPEGLSAASSST